MSGLQAMRSTRAAGLATPVIVMTALSDPRIPDQVKSLGGNTVFLRKPFAASELEAAAAVLVGQTSHGELRK
jgi:DNA-binding response OmpR family regulator